MWVATLALALAAPARADEAQVVAEQALSPRVVELTISTPAFSGATKVHVDLPVGYAAEPTRRWPVTYFLAGTMNTCASFNNVVGGVELSQGFPPIIVSPNGDSGYWRLSPAGQRSARSRGAPGRRRRGRRRARRGCRW